MIHKWYKVPYQRSKIYLEPSPQCPLLERCHALNGINCKDRDWQKCDLIINILSDNRHVMSDKMRELWERYERILTKPLPHLSKFGWARSDKRPINIRIIVPDLKGFLTLGNVLKVSSCWYDRPYRDFP